MNILVISASPNRDGLTSACVKAAITGLRAGGAQADEVRLNDLKVGMCHACDNGWGTCRQQSVCQVEDDFQALYDQLLACNGLILASPIFFYAVSSHTKILMDRCQSLWVKKYWIEKATLGRSLPKRKGIFISVGATKGKRLFDGALLSIRYFFDPLDMELWKALLYRGLDLEGDVLKHPEFLEEAYEAGKCLCEAISMHAFEQEVSGNKESEGR